MTTAFWPLGDVDPCADPEPDEAALRELVAMVKSWPFAPRRLPETTVKALAELWCQILLRNLERNPPPNQDMLIANKHSLGAL